MCGIAGFYNYKTSISADEQSLNNVLESMRYRGPDHLGIFKDNDVAIGNVRLSILGLTEEGNQPVFNEDRSVVVVYNGEIYNYPELKSFLEKKGHSFYTSTDTEILVHLFEEYGTDMAKDLNGMFAFALFDIKKRIMLLGRDRTAQKPLYINRNKNGIFFSSELKAMLPYLASCSLNPSAIRTFLSIGYALEPETILNEIETVEPGSIISFSDKGEHVKKFWHAEIEQSEVFDSLEEWKEQADIIFKKAVRRHLLSDVPVTLLLSGGIDSSLISLYLREENQIKKAFTGSFVDRKDHDEYDYAFRLGSYCGFEVERIYLSNKYLSDNLEDLLSVASIPQGDYSGLATYCMAKAISKEYRVVLGGDGGDELFGGYPTYTFPYLSHRYPFVPKSVIKAGHRLSSLLHDKRRYLSMPFKLQQLSQAWGQNAAKAHFQLKNFLPEQLECEILEELFVRTDSNVNTGESVFESFYNNDLFSDTVHKLCWIDFNTFLRSQTIPKVDRNTMLFSLEARIPYLDNEVLNLSIHTDSSLMVRKTDTKKCLKALLKDKVSGRIDMNPIKQGFSPPLVEMFENDLRPWKEHWMDFKTPFLKKDVVEKLSKWRQRGWDLHRLEWNICVLNDWCYRNNLL